MGEAIEKPTLIATVLADSPPLLLSPLPPPSTVVAPPASAPAVPSSSPDTSPFDTWLLESFGVTGLIGFVVAVCFACFCCCVAIWWCGWRQGDKASKYRVKQKQTDACYASGGAPPGAGNRSGSMPKMPSRTGSRGLARGESARAAVHPSLGRMASLGKKKSVDRFTFAEVEGLNAGAPEEEAWRPHEW